MLNIQNLINSKVPVYAKEDYTPMKNSTISTNPSMVSTGAYRTTNNGSGEDETTTKAYKLHLAKLLKDIDLLFLSVHNF